MNRNRSRGLACFRRIALLALLWLTACCVFARESKAAALVDDSFAQSSRRALLLPAASTTSRDVAERRTGFVVHSCSRPVSAMEVTYAS